jgi:hypothetical protein
MYTSMLIICADVCGSVPDPATTKKKCLNYYIACILVCIVNIHVHRHAHTDYIPAHASTTIHHQHDVFAAHPDPKQSIHTYTHTQTTYLHTSPPRFIISIMYLQRTPIQSSLYIHTNTHTYTHTDYIPAHASTMIHHQHRVFAAHHDPKQSACEISPA